MCHCPAHALTCTKSSSLQRRLQHVIALSQTVLQVYSPPRNPPVLFQRRIQRQSPLWGKLAVNAQALRRVTNHCRSYKQGNNWKLQRPQRLIRLSDGRVHLARRPGVRLRAGTGRKDRLFKKKKGTNSWRQQDRFSKSCINNIKYPRWLKYSIVYYSIAYSLAWA